MSAVGVLLLAATAAKADVVVGEVRMWAGAIVDVPSGWFFCDGLEVSRTNFPDLFAAIGTLYGEGDGAATFNLPDFRDRSPMGASQDDAGVPKTVVTGSPTQSGGEALHTLTIAEMPSHTHNAAVSTDPLGAGGGPEWLGIGATTPAGGDQPHNNLRPYFAITYIIAAEPSPPTVPTVSEWGLILMTLLAMTLGTIMLARRRAIYT